MALEMKVHKDVANYEAKPMFGMTWRRLAALAIMIIGGGGLFFAVTGGVLAATGGSWGDADDLARATNVGMYAMFPVLIPAAMWAWLRPMGLKPEVYAQYFFRHQLTRRVITYEDSYAHTSAGPGEREPVPSGTHEPAQQPPRRRRFNEARLARSLSEHQEKPRRVRPGNSRR